MPRRFRINIFTGGSADAPFDREAEDPIGMTDDEQRRYLAAIDGEPCPTDDLPPSMRFVDEV